MGQRFITADRDQVFLMPPCVRDWLPADHLAWFVLDAVEQFDLDAFYGGYRADGHGRPAFDPALMVALMLYAYCVGVRSRGIERRCREDVAFRVIAGKMAPDHATIARFSSATRKRGGTVRAGAGDVREGGAGRARARSRSTRPSCRQRVGRRQSLDYERIAREIIREGIATDRAEEELYGEARGDELPPELADPKHAAASGCGRPRPSSSAEWAAEQRRTRSRCSSAAPSIRPGPGAGRRGARPRA